MAISGVDSNTATIALGYADAITEIYSQEWMIHRFGRLGPTKIRVPLDVRGRVWFNADLESKNYIVPGLIAVIMMVIAAMLTSLTFAREWERGTMEQLISTPVQGAELILGKLIPYFAIGLLGHGAGGASSGSSCSRFRSAATWPCSSAWPRSSWSACWRWACSSASSPRANSWPASWR